MLAGAGFVLSLGLTAVHAAMLLPVLVVAATLLLVRAGERFLDRLVITLVTLYGFTCGIGLLFSVWPWHLHPVAVAAVAFAVLAAIVAGGRRPKLPPAPRVDEAAALVLTAGVAAFVAVALFRHPLAQRLGVFMMGDDSSRHFAIFDYIRRGGSYLFIRQPPGPRILDVLVPYPQGMHFTWALADNFAHSSTHVPAPLALADDFLVFGVITYGLFALATLWAVLRLAGPRPRLWAALVGLVTLAAWCTLGYLITLHQRGYSNQLVSLGLMLVAVVLSARPLPAARNRTALIVFAAAIVGTAFTNFLMLPVQAVAALVWMWRQRRWLVAHWRLFVGVAIVTCAVAVVPVYVNVSTAATGFINGGGPVVAPRPLLTVALVVACLAAPVFPAVRRSPAFAAMAVNFAGAGLVALLVALNQIATAGRVGYYFVKSLQIFVLLAAVTLAALAVGGLTGLAARKPGHRIGLLAPGMGSAVLAALLLWGALTHAGAQRDTFPENQVRHGSFGWAYLRGRLMLADPDVVVEAVRTTRHADQADVAWALTRNPGEDYYASQFMATFEGKFTDRIFGAVVSPRALRRTEANLDLYLRNRGDQPIRLITRSPYIEKQVQRYTAAHPEARVTVWVVSG